jgi:hypothetical protein
MGKGTSIREILKLSYDNEVKTGTSTIHRGNLSRLTLKSLINIIHASNSYGGTSAQAE